MAPVFTGLERVVLRRRIGVWVENAAIHGGDLGRTWCVAQGTKRLGLIKVWCQDRGPSMLVIGGEGNESGLVSSMCLALELETLCSRSATEASRLLPLSIGHQ